MIHTDAITCAEALHEILAVLAHRRQDAAAGENMRVGNEISLAGIDKVSAENALVETNRTDLGGIDAAGVARRIAVLGITRR